MKWLVWLSIGLFPLLAQHSKRDLAAERKQLERRRLALEQELSQTQHLLSQTRKARQKSLTELALLRRQISLQEKVLYNLQQELMLLEQDIYQLATLSQALFRDLKKLYRNYLWTLYLLDKTSHQLNPWFWVLSAESFRQAYARLLYLRAISRFREEQLRLIQRTQAYLESRSQTLQKNRAEKVRLLTLYGKKAEELEKARKQKQALYAELRGKEATYKKKINLSRKELIQIQAKIDKLIQLELQAQKKQNLSAAELRINGAFEQNKGLLPWPIASDQVVVTSTFGLIEDESGGLVSNHGIYLAAPSGAEVRAIFGGKVTAVTTLPIQGKVVIIQHGNYRTVYAGLQETYVQMGQQVSILTPIGKMPESRDGPPQLYFLVYQGKNPVNPLQWIAAR